MSAFNLLVEKEFNNVERCEEYQEILQEDGSKKKEKVLYVNGIFGQYGEKNQNGRIYQRDEMISEVNRYIEEEVKQCTAFSELNHPSTVEVDPRNSCDRVTELRVDESNGYVYGKARVMDTPDGRIVRAILESGGRIGKSSRCLGNVQESMQPDGSSANLVSNMKLICFDSVHGPSVKKAMTDPLFEQRQWIMSEKGQYMEVPFENWEKRLSNTPKGNKEEYLIECFEKFFQEKSEMERKLRGI